MKILPKVRSHKSAKPQKNEAPEATTIVRRPQPSQSLYEISSEAPALGSAQLSKSAPQMAQLQVRHKSEATLFAKALAQAIIPGTSKGELQEALDEAQPDALMQLLQARFLKAQKNVLKSPLPLRADALGAQYIDVGRLVPAQLRISIERVKEKVVQLGVPEAFDMSDAGLTPKFDEGRSPIPLQYLKPVVKMPNDRFLVIDGNHQVSAALLSGAASVPCDVVADLSHLDETQFFEEAEEKGWLYLRDFGGAASVQKPSYGTLQNDPFRFVLSQSALKVRLKEGALFYDQPPNIEEKAWVKLRGKSVDFVEFKLADVLYRASENDSSLAPFLEAATPKEKASFIRALLKKAESRGEIDSKALGILWTDEGALEKSIAEALSQDD